MSISCVVLDGTRYNGITMGEYHFKGFRAPAFTQLPNEVVDVLLPHLNEGELKCLLYIVRRTFGFQRETDNISLSQMVDGLVTSDGRRLDSGIGMSKATVARSLKGLQDKGIITSQRRRDPQRGDLPTTYQLKFSPEE